MLIEENEITRYRKLLPGLLSIVLAAGENLVFTESSFDKAGTYTGEVVLTLVKK